MVSSYGNWNQALCVNNQGDGWSLDYCLHSHECGSGLVRFYYLVARWLIQRLRASGGHLLPEVLKTTRRLRALGGHLPLEVLGTTRRLRASALQGLGHEGLAACLGYGNTPV